MHRFTCNGLWLVKLDWQLTWQTSPANFPVLNGNVSTSYPMFYCMQQIISVSWFRHHSQIGTYEPQCRPYLDYLKLDLYMRLTLLDCFYLAVQPLCSTAVHGQNNNFVLSTVKLILYSTSTCMLGLWHTKKHNYQVKSGPS